MAEASDIRLVSYKAGIDLPSGRVYFGERGEKLLEMKKCPYDTPFFGHMYIADNLRHVLRGEAEPVIKPEETINTAAVLELFYKSARCGGKTVYL